VKRAADITRKELGEVTFLYFCGVQLDVPIPVPVKSVPLKFQLNLKGQSHKKIGERRPWDVSLGSN
jgi:hypothetical protein